MKGPFTAPAFCLALCACSQPVVEAEMVPSCGPLDGSAFDVAVPDGEDVVTLTGPGAPREAGGVYAIDIANRTNGATIGRCNAGRNACEWATEGTFALAPQDDGTFSGTLSAAFPQAGSRRISFVARVAEDVEPPMCG